MKLIVKIQPKKTQISEKTSYFFKKNINEKNKYLFLILKTW